MSKKALAELFQRWIKRSNRMGRVATSRRRPKLGLETVEDRLAPATLPTPSVAVPSALASGFSPAAASDPSNPLDMVVVSAHDGTDGGGLIGQYSLDGGATWNTFLDSINGLDTDPQTGVAYANASSPAIAFAPDGSVFITYLETSAGGSGTVPSSGAVAVDTYTFDAAAGGISAAHHNIVYQWVNQDAALNPTVAVDTNSATNPATGATLPVDSMLGTSPLTTTKTVYVAWNTEATKPDYVGGGYFNPYAILAVASGDEGANFTSPVVVSSGGYFGYGASAPQILFTPNTTNPQTLNSATNANGTPGSLSIVWQQPPVTNVENGTTVTQSNSLPDGGNPNQEAAAAADFPGAGGGITQAIAPPPTPTPVHPALPSNPPLNPNLYPTIIPSDNPNNPVIPYGAGAITVYVNNQTGALDLDNPDGIQVVIDIPTGFQLNPTLPFAAGWSFVQENPIYAPNNGYQYQEFFGTYNGGAVLKAGQSLAIQVTGTYTNAAPYDFLVQAEILQDTLGTNNVDQELYLVGTKTPDIPQTSTFTTNVSFAGYPDIAASDLVTDLTASVAIVDPHIADLRITLVAPDGQSIDLLLNHTNADDSVNPGVGLPGVTNIGVGASGYADTDGGTGTVFDDNAPAPIEDGSNVAPYIGHYQPEGGSLESLYTTLTASGDVSGSAAAATGTWQLVIVDYYAYTPPPTQYLANWDLHFSFDIQNGNSFDASQNSITKVAIDGSENIVTTDTVKGGANQSYPTLVPVSPVFGVGPGISVAFDTGYGAGSPYAGREYMAYTGLAGNINVDGTLVTTTNIYLIYSDDGGVNWSEPVQVNDDTVADNVTTGGRVHFMPTVTVDPTTGTVVVMWYDARNDAADTRVATYIATSIDGGQTFSENTFLNSSKQAINALDPSQVVTLEPIPSTVVGSGAYQFGIHQAVIAEGGQIVTFWTGNAPFINENDEEESNNSTGTEVYSNIVTIPDGPRVVTSDSGPVIAQSVITDGFGNPTSITLPGSKTISTYNDTFAANGTRELTGFEVVFDRPVVSSSFTASQVYVNYVDPSTDVGTQVAVGTPIPIAPVGLVTDTSGAGQYFATDGSGLVDYFPAGTTNAFFIPFTTPQSAVGTYSYAIGPSGSFGATTSVGLDDGVESGSPTWAATDVPIPITPDNSATLNPTTVSSSLKVSGVSPLTLLGDVSVKVNISAPMDLDGNGLQDENLTLNLTFTPSGGGKPITVQLFKNEPPSAEDFEPINQQGFYLTTFDDSGSAFSDFNNPPYTGIFAPDSYTFASSTMKGLATLNDLSPNGTWTLSITNNGGESTGILTGWGLELKDSSGDLIEQPSLGNLMDQNTVGLGGESITPSGTYTPGLSTNPVENATYTNPDSTSNVPFSQPYASATTPLVIPGPQVVNTSVVVSPVSGESVTTTSQPVTVSSVTPVAGTNTVLVTLSEPIDPSSFPASALSTVTASTSSLNSPLGPVTVSGVTPVYPSLDLSLQAGQVSVNVTFAAPPGAFTTSDIVSLTGPAGNIDPSTNLEITPTADPTVYQISFVSGGFPAPLTAGGQYIFQFNSKLLVTNPGMTQGTPTATFQLTLPSTTVSAVAPTLTAGATSYTVVFSSPPLQFTPADIASIKDPNGYPLPGPFTVTQVSATNYSIGFAEPLVLSGTYKFTFSSPSQDLSTVFNNLLNNATSLTVTFPNAPVLFNTSDITTVTNTISIAASPNGATEVGTTVTITTASTASLQVGQQVTITGVAVAGYNGTFSITGVISPTQFTYTNPTAGLAASGGGTVAAVVTGSFSVTPVATNPDYQFIIKFPTTSQGAGLAIGSYTFTFDSAALTLARGATSGSLTFANVPAYPVNANDIESVVGPNGPVAGPFTLTADPTDITGHRYILGFPSSVTAAGTYNVTFFPITPGNVQPATGYADLTFTNPPTTFTASAIQLVTTSTGASVSGTFGVIEISPTVYRVTGLPTNTTTDPIQYLFTINPLLPVVTNSYSLDLNATATRPTNGLALDGTISAIDVTFDRDMSAASFTTANVLQISGPAGSVPLVDPTSGLSTLTITPVGTANATDGGYRTFQVSFPVQTVSGDYTIQLGPNTTQTNPALASVRSADTSTFSGVLAPGTTSVTIQFVPTSVSAKPTNASVASVTGPNGAAISGPFTFAPTGVAGAYTMSFPTALTLRGTYTIQFTTASKLQVVGLQVDNNQNAGVAELRGIDPNATVITSTYSSTSNPANAGGVQIQPNGTTSIPITVPDNFIVQPGSSPSQQIQVLFNIDFPYDPDLDIDLVAPNGTSITLFTGSDIQNEPNQENFTNTLLEDSATTASGLTVTPITSALPPYNPGSGAFNPQLPLSQLTGVSALGTWELVVTNMSDLAGGEIVNVTLTLPHTETGTGLGESVADRITVPFRVFNEDPTNVTSQAEWTAVGAGSQNTGLNAGQITALAVDPSDPSGNTVYAAAASGGLWKTTDFMTTQPGGPNWIPLTDFGPTTSLNIGSIAVYPENNNPNDTVILVGTGQFGTGYYGSGGTDGTTLGDPGIDNAGSQTPGVGFLLSTDGGQTWQVLDSTSNYGSNGQILSINDANRDHEFDGTSIAKVIIDPTPSASGQLVFYAAVVSSTNTNIPGGSAGGVWRSTDTGKTWQLVQSGNATDVTLAAGSQGTGTNKNLQILYAGIVSGAQGAGVYYTPSAPSAGSMQLLVGGTQNPLFVNDDNNEEPIPINSVGVNPEAFGALGRISLATPALTSSPLLNASYQGWLYALVTDPTGTNTALYMTKDFGRNWTAVQMPNNDNGFGNGTNDYTQPQTRLVAGGTNFQSQSASDTLSLAIDPQNPNIVYLGGANFIFSSTGDETTGTGLLRIDTTKLLDTQAVVAYNNSLPLAVNGQLPQFNPTAGANDTTGNAVIDDNPPNDPPYLGSGQLYGIDPTNANSIDEPTVDTGYLNLFRDPNNPFATNSTIHFINIQSLQNQGYGAVVEPFTSAELLSNVHAIVTFVDPVTGQTRLLIGDDNGISTVLDSGASDILGPGAGTNVANIITSYPGYEPNVTLSRNGDLQIAQYYSGGVQPSQLAADIAGAMIYGMSYANGFGASDPNVLQNGDVNWTASGGYTVATGSGNGVVTAQDGTGTVYEFRDPETPGNDSTGTLYIPTDFVRQIANTASDPAGISVTNGLLLAGDAPQEQQGEWTVQYGSTLAINPLDSNALLVSATGTAQGNNGAGAVFLTTDPTTTWFEIGLPGTASAPGTSGPTLDGSYGDALAFGAPSPADQADGLVNKFIYVGTQDGNVFVTDTGGAPWLNITAGLGDIGALDGSPVMSIAPDPRPGTTDVFVVTQQGVYYKADAFDTTSGWVNVTGNLFSLQNGLYGDQTNQLPTLQFLTSLAVDWRYQIPVDPTNPTSTATFPVVYVGGDAGVYQSTDILAQTNGSMGPTWNYFPAGQTYTDSEGDTVTVPNGGYLPNVMVTNLSLSLGDINTATGLPEQSGGDDLLVATTFGRGSFAIRLGDVLPANNVEETSGPRVTQLINPNTLSGPSDELEVKFSGPVDAATFTPSTVLLTAPGSNGKLGATIPITGVTEVPDIVGGADQRDTYLITFAPQTVAGSYQITIGYNPNGSNIPTITDLSGNLMNQNDNDINGQAVVDQYTALVTLNSSTNEHLTVTTYPGTTVAGTPQTVTIQVHTGADVLDTSENGTITLTSSLGSSALSPVTLMVTNGVATGQVTFYKAGANLVTATFAPSAGSGPANSAIFTTTVTAADATHLLVTPASSVVSSPATVDFQVIAADPYGNTDTNYAQTATLTSTGVASEIPASVTLTNGVGAFTGTFNVTGDVSISASAPAVTVGTVTYPVLTTPTPATVSVNPGIAVSLVVKVSTNPVQVGTADTVTVTAYDSNGNQALLNGPASVSLTDPAGTVNSTFTFVNGVATGTVTFNTTGTQTVTAASNGLTGSAPVVVTATVVVTHPVQLVSSFAVGTGVNGIPQVLVYNSAGTLQYTFVPFPAGYLGEVAVNSDGFTGGLRVAMGDLTGDGVPDIIVGSGPSITASVVVYSGKTGLEILNYQPFGTFTGGVFVAVGNIMNHPNGMDDLVITPDQGGGPRVQVLEGGTFQKVADFYGLNNPAFRGGARAAVGDLNDDGYADVVVSAGYAGGPVVSVYDGKALSQGQIVNVVGNFYAFSSILRNGTYVAVGDVNGDGYGDIIIGAGPGGGPEVEIISGYTLLTEGASEAIAHPIANFFAGDPNNRGGVTVAAKDLTGGTDADVVTGDGGGSTVTTYAGSALSSGEVNPLYTLDVDPGYTGGVYVG